MAEKTDESQPCPRQFDRSASVSKCHPILGLCDAKWHKGLSPHSRSMHMKFTYSWCNMKIDYKQTDSGQRRWANYDFAHPRFPNIRDDSLRREVYSSKNSEFRSRSPPPPICDEKNTPTCSAKCFLFFPPVTLIKRLRTGRGGVPSVPRAPSVQKASRV